MKNLFLAIIILFSANSFAQEDTYTKNVKKAIDIYSGEQNLDNIAKGMLNKLPKNKSKNNSLNRAIKTAKDKAFNEALTRFKTKFSEAQINTIITELAGKREDYSGATNNFIRQWGISKRKYMSEINVLYLKYQ